MVTDGGATSGYCEIGKRNMDNMPTNMIMMAITHARIGLSIKLLAMSYPSCALFACGATGTTVIPGPIFCKPVVMTLSPLSSPVNANQS